MDDAFDERKRTAGCALAGVLLTLALGGCVLLAWWASEASGGAS